MSSKFSLTAQLKLQAPANTRQVVDQMRRDLQGGINVPVQVKGARQAKKEIPRYMMHICKETTAISYFELRWRYDYCNFMGTSSCLETVEKPLNEHMDWILKLLPEILKSV